MDLIRTKIKYKEPDDILEVTWSFLWNITGTFFLDLSILVVEFLKILLFKMKHQKIVKHS